MSRLHKLRDDLESARAYDVAPPAAVDTGSILIVVQDEVRHLPTAGAVLGHVVTYDPAVAGKVKWAAGGGGGGGVTDHVALTSLSWLVSGHVSTANRIAGFGAAGAAALFTVGADVQAWGATLDALQALGTGLVAKTAANTLAARTITSATTDFLTVANGDGVAGNPTATVLPLAILLLYRDERFGDGSDGDVTLTVNTTLGRDMNYRTLNLAGFTLTNSGYRIAVRDVLTTAGGTISTVTATINGSAPAAGSGAVGGSLGAGGIGGNGSSTAAAGSNATNLANVWSQKIAASDGTTGRGGGGGTGTGGTVLGGSSGTVAAPSTASGWLAGWLYTGQMLASGLVRLIGGSGGGGGGGGGGVSNFAGGGGAGGGILSVCARRIVATGGGTLQAPGGSGGNATGANCGGGGGGGGGHVYCLFGLITGTLTLTAAGGAAGLKTGTGVNGAVGLAGTTEAVCVLG